MGQIHFQQQIIKFNLLHTLIACLYIQFIGTTFHMYISIYDFKLFLAFAFQLFSQFGTLISCISQKTIVYTSVYKRKKSFTFILHVALTYHKLFLWRLSCHNRYAELIRYHISKPVSNKLSVIVCFAETVNIYKVEHIWCIRWYFDTSCHDEQLLYSAQWLITRPISSIDCKQKYCVLYWALKDSCHTSL